MTPTSKISALAFAALGLAFSASQQAGETPPAVEQAKFTQAQLEQLVAPIALHPDTLLAQILSASTYPIEIVQAQRWVDAHDPMKGVTLEEALKSQPWDPSVKALCGFPTVLKQMSENLDWTRDLGDAFLGQKADLMDTVQRMRKKALDAGTLKTTPQQKVEQTDGTIVVEPTAPDVIYVPAYSPLVVYGPGWGYPYWYYPYGYYPPPAGMGYVSFGIGFWWGSACWSHCDWHRHGVFVDAVAFQNFSARTSPAPVGIHASGQFEWTHDPSHRKGVSYRDPVSIGSFGRALESERRGGGSRPAPPDLRERPSREPPAPPARHPRGGGHRPDGFERRRR